MFIAVCSAFFLGFPFFSDRSCVSSLSLFSSLFSSHVRVIFPSAFLCFLFIYFTLFKLLILSGAFSVVYTVRLSLNTFGAIRQCFF